MPFRSLKTAAWVLLIAAISLGFGAGQSMRPFNFVPLGFALLIHVTFWKSLAGWAESTNIDFVKKFHLLLAVGTLLVVKILTTREGSRLRESPLTSLFYSIVVAIYPIYVIQKFVQRGMDELPTTELVTSCYLVDLIILHSLRDFYLMVYKFAMVYKNVRRF